MTLCRRGALGTSLLLPLLAVGGAGTASSVVEARHADAAPGADPERVFVRAEADRGLTRPLVSRGHLLYVRPAQLEKITARRSRSA